VRPCGVLYLLSSGLVPGVSVLLIPIGGGLRVRAPPLTLTSQCNCAGTISVTCPAEGQPQWPRRARPTTEFCRPVWARCPCCRFPWS